MFSLSFRLLLTLFVIAFSLSNTTLLAQDQVEENNQEEDNYQVDRFVVSAGFGQIQPQGQFAENINNRLGGSFGFYTRISKQFPLFAGIDVGIFNLNRYSERFFLTDDEGFVFEVEERTNSKLLQLHAVIRAQPYFDFFLHPYGEVYLGQKHFYTRTVLKDLEAPSDDDTIDNTGQAGAWTLSVGAAIGINIPLTAAHNGGIELDIKFVYLKGGAANYSVLLDEEDIDFSTYEDTFDAFEIRNSTTDLWMPQLGLIAYFGG